MMFNMTATQYEREEAGRRWKEVSSQTKEVDKTHYKRVVEAKAFFRRMGGTERHTSGYTSNGYYIVVKVVSTGPNGLHRTIYEFD